MSESTIRIQCQGCDTFTMINHHHGLTVCVLDRESHERTCGYWYTIRTPSLAHVAFRTKAACVRWMADRGLFVGLPLTDPGVHSWQPIAGEYREQMHLDAMEFYKTFPVVTARVMSNGEYVEGRITIDPDGIRTVHTLNPNVRTRRVFDHDESRQLQDAGQ